MKLSQIRSLMLADLARSGLDASDAEHMGCKPLGSKKGRRPHYKIPYFDEHGAPTGHWRKRYLDDKGGDRYWQLPDSGVHLYFPPSFDECSPTAELYIVEGEKKAALMVKLGYRTVGLGGVTMFHAKKDPELLASLKKLAIGAWCCIAFDGNTHTNADVMRERNELALRLEKKAIEVALIDLPAKDMNLDDWLVEQGGGAERFDPDKAITAFAALKRRPPNPRERIAALRRTPTIPGSPKDRERYVQISNVVQADMLAEGRFFRTETGLLYFDSQGKQVVRMDAERDEPICTFLNRKYGINSAEHEFRFVYADLRTLGMTRGELVEPPLFSHYNDATGTLYLMRAETRMWRITEKGCEEVDNGDDGVVLRPPPGMVAIEPAERAEDEAFGYLLSLPNIVIGAAASVEQQRMLFGCWIMGVIVGPGVLPTRPIVLAHGPRGAAKTTAGRATQRLLFGSGADVAALDPRKLDGLDAELHASRMTTLDNVDGRYPGIEDRLARAATGGKLKLRKLYTTNEAVSVTIHAFLMITSRDPKSFSRDDVVDRLLYIKVARRSKFIAENAILKKVAAMRPAFWRSFLDIAPKLVAALKKRDVNKAGDFRMADFAAFAIAIGPVLGHNTAEVKDALVAMEAEKLAFAASQSEVADALTELVALKKDLRSKDFFGKELRAGAILQALLAVDKARFERVSPTEFGKQLVNDWDAIRQRVQVTCAYSKHLEARVYTFMVPK